MYSGHTVYSIEFTHVGHTDPHSPPLFALHKHLLGIMIQDEVDTAVRTIATAAPDRIASHPEGFPDQTLEFPPGHLVQCSRRLALRDLQHEILSPVLAEGTNDGADDKDQGHDVLTKVGQ